VDMTPALFTIAAALAILAGAGFIADFFMW
jgi:hypothetical protein